MKRSTLIQQLEELDFFPSIYHSRVLSLLIQQVQPRTAKQISSELDLPDSKVYPALKDLEQWDLVSADESRRPKQFALDNPQNLRRYLERQLDREMTQKRQYIDDLISYSNFRWDPNEFELGNIAHIYRGDDIQRELVRHLKLAQKQLFLLLAKDAVKYLPLLQQFLLPKIEEGCTLHLALPGYTAWNQLQKDLSSLPEVRVKTSRWTQSSYIIRDHKVMMNIMHSSEDVAMVTNDDLLVENIRGCWNNDACCSQELIQLEENYHR